MNLRWPRGKHNGEKIDGFRLCVEVHVLSWEWMPLSKWNFGEPYFIWLCFTVRARQHFSYRYRVTERPRANRRWER